MKRIITFLKWFFISFGLGTFLYLILSYYFNQTLSFRTLWAIFWACLFGNLFEQFFAYIKGITFKSVWVRRIVIMLICGIITQLVFLYFNVISYEFTPIGIVIGLVAGTIYNFVSEYYEKKSIEKVNIKLRDYTD